MTTATIPLAELTTVTIQLLCREIGIVNTARFLSQFTMGYGIYTEEREQLLGDLTVDEIAAEIQKKRQNGKLRNVARSQLRAKTVSEEALPNTAAS